MAESSPRSFSFKDINIFISYKSPPAPPLFNIIIIDNIYDTNLKERSWPGGQVSESVRSIPWNVFGMETHHADPPKAVRFSNPCNYRTGFITGIKDK